MASVSSLDQDMRRLRMDRYTSKSADEVRTWIETTLGEQLAPGDLIDSLKDGVALCKLANLVLPPPGVKFKNSSMPFTQRENISQFLTVCERPPLSLPAHDRFLTVDLYDNKDPAQVIQCLVAFSRAAHAAAPSKVSSSIGPKRTGATSPTRVALGSEGSTIGRLNGASNSSQGSDPGFRAMSPTSTGGSKPSAPVTSWSKRTDEFATMPAWNIHQYGYMGGASQGNQGISFGARRQITTNGPEVPSLADKERRRKEKELEEERQRQEAEDARRRRQAEFEEQEREARLAEQSRAELEIQKSRDQERQQLEAERRKWEDEEQRWREEEERRKREIESLQTSNRSGFNGYSQNPRLDSSDPSAQTSERQRILDLERQLEEARAREKQYELEREQKKTSTPQPETDSYRRPDVAIPSQPLTPSKPQPLQPQNQNRDSWSSSDDRVRLRQGRNETSAFQPTSSSSSNNTPNRPRPLPTPNSNFNPEDTSSLRATPQSLPSTSTPTTTPQTNTTPSHPPSNLQSTTPTRPLPSPSAAKTTYSTPFAAQSTRTGRFLSSNPAPIQSSPRINSAAEMGFTSTSEKAAEDARRIASQKSTKAGGWASKSLLEREMERERERQREWEQQQMAKMSAAGGGAGGVKGPRQMGA